MPQTEILPGQFRVFDQSTDQTLILYTGDFTYGIDGFPETGVINKVEYAYIGFNLEDVNVNIEEVEVAWLEEYFEFFPSWLDSATSLTLQGTNESNFQYIGPNDDLSWGGDYEDKETDLTINGRGERDVIEMEQVLYDTSFYGGAGNDEISIQIDTNNYNLPSEFDGVLHDLNGGNGNDTIYSFVTEASVTLRGGAGDDQLFAYSHDSTILGGGGDDFISLAFLFDPQTTGAVIRGGEGNDQIYSGIAPSFFNDVDSFTLSEAWSTYTAGIGDDTIFFAGRVRVSGGDGSDRLVAHIYEPGMTQAVVKDFDPASDNSFRFYTEPEIDRTAQESFEFFNTHAVQRGEKVVFEYNDNRIVFRDLDLDDLTVDNFGDDI